MTRLDHERPDRPVALLWDNFGPIHVDRAEALAAWLGPARPVVGLEISPHSDTYDWTTATGEGFRKVTLFATAEEAREASTRRLARAIVGAVRAAGARDVFVCSYDRPGVLLGAHLLRLGGRRVYAMGCSKFDDTPRLLWREIAKRLALSAFRGAIGSGERSRDYFRLLGIAPSRVVGEYNALSIARIRAEAGIAPAPGGTPFAERHFTIVARFVAKKNLAAAIVAYDRYRRAASAPRALHLYGSGPLEGELRAQVATLGLGEHVRFEGFRQSAAIAQALGRSLALLLPSRIEPFGNAVIEAQAMGVPVILSEPCGARDRLIRSGVNGFVVRPDDIDGIAFYMAALEDAARWRAMAAASAGAAMRNDASRFAAGAAALLGERREVALAGPSR